MSAHNGSKHFGYVTSFDELDVDNENIRLFIRSCGISLNLLQSLPNDFHCRTWVGSQPISP